MSYRYTCAIFVLHEEKVLLIKHKKLNRWLPPGGCIESDETPDEAALREVYEEVGVHIELLVESALPLPDVKVVHQPIHIQVEQNPKGPNNIDFIYYAKLMNKNCIIKLNLDEALEYRWCDRSSIENLIPQHELRINALKALDFASLKY